MRNRYFLLFFILLVISILNFNAVDNTLTSTDKKQISVYMNDIKPLVKNPTFDDQLSFIKSVQKLVLHINSTEYSLLFDSKKIYHSRIGLCFVRSRLIEKILRYSGFKIRHIAMYTKINTNSSIKSLFTPDVLSHAITEVLTKNGWILVDSNAPWVSLDSTNNPISIKKLQYSLENSQQIKWKIKAKTIFYTKPFTFVYGLYSRHGKLYPPYNAIPDINYKELLYNIFQYF